MQRHEEKEKREVMIEILKYEKADKNKIIGYVDVKVSVTKPTEFIFRRIAHLSSNDKKWLNYPSYPKQMDDGKPQYLRYAEFQEDTLNKKFFELLAVELKSYLEKYPVQAEKDNFVCPVNEWELPF